MIVAFATNMMFQIVKSQGALWCTSSWCYFWSWHKVVISQQTLCTKNWCHNSRLWCENEHMSHNLNIIIRGYDITTNIMMCKTMMLSFSIRRSQDIMMPTPEFMRCPLLWGHESWLYHLMLKSMMLLFMVIMSPQYKSYFMVLKSQ